ncbi:MAG: DMT family transporter, partial [Vallitaleaceae bacterium]|nr:DMT family transporter [Vallitaleaceae bacterium]
MSGFIFALIAGSFMAIQGVFNTRLTESSSMWVANTVVHSTGLVVCLLL